MPNGNKKLIMFRIPKDNQTVHYIFGLAELDFPEDSIECVRDMDSSPEYRVTIGPRYTIKKNDLILGRQRSFQSVY